MGGGFSTMTSSRAMSWYGPLLESQSSSISSMPPGTTASALPILKKGHTRPASWSLGATRSTSIRTGAVYGVQVSVYDV